VPARPADVRLPALRALEAVGPEAKAAVPALVAALGIKDEGVRAAAARLLGRFGPAPGVVEALTRALDDASNDVRQAAAEALLAVTAREK
jgi:HEAT repeat protein